MRKKHNFIPPKEISSIKKLKFLQDNKYNRNFNQDIQEDIEYKEKKSNYPIVKDESDNAYDTNETEQIEITGFMPKRRDFDIEFDNDAELLLAEMEFNDTDTQEQIDMKFRILDIYNLRLKERNIRKNFVIDRDMLNLKRLTMLDKTQSKEQKEIYNLMKPFARFNTPMDHEKLVQGIIKERQVRSRIEELNFYIKIGLTNYQEVEEYKEAEKKKQELFQKKQKNKYIFDESKQKRTSQNRRRKKNMDINEINIDKKSTFIEKEIYFCNHFEIDPYEYLLIKDFLIRENIKQNGISIDFAEKYLNYDKQYLELIFQLLSDNKLISRKNQKKKAKSK